MKYLGELEEAKLIEKKRRGQGFGSWIFLRKFMDDPEREVQNSSADEYPAEDEALCEEVTADEDGDSAGFTDNDGDKTSDYTDAKGSGGI